MHADRSFLRSSAILSFDSRLLQAHWKGCIAGQRIQRRRVRLVRPRNSSYFPLPGGVLEGPREKIPHENFRAAQENGKERFAREVGREKERRTRKKGRGEKNRRVRLREENGDEKNLGEEIRRSSDYNAEIDDSEIGLRQIRRQACADQEISR